MNRANTNIGLFELQAPPQLGLTKQLLILELNGFLSTSNPICRNNKLQQLIGSDTHLSAIYATKSSHFYDMESKF